MSPIRLGPFQLDSPLGRGGMGEVWRGLHSGQRLPVAVKVITAVQAREPGYLAAFRTEVRAVAGLDHPGVVLVFDYGEVPPEAAEASDGRLRAGSPYLVMELLTGGRLDKLPPPVSWSELRALLRSLLGALAHAHARGVVHRDLKLSNVLLGGPDDVRPGHRLIDFGLASLSLDEGGGPHALSAGTPAFEAPEQILGHWRDQGPWTDLYAFGCMAYALAAGAAPFEGDDLERIHRCHLMVPMPQLENRIPVPRGFEGWLARLLSKHPGDRFLSAAEALYGLDALPSRVTDPSLFRTPRLASLPASGAGRLDDGTPSSEAVTRPTHCRLAEGALAASLASAAPAPPPGTEEPMAVRQPPLPADWRHDESGRERPSPRLVGAGLGLYGLRAIPLVDRTGERDVLWDCLREVRRAGTARLVVLRGAVGSGKSRLAEWLAERAHELSGAVTLRAVHSRIEGPADGLPRMLAQHLSCLGSSRSEALARVERLLHEQGVREAYEWHGLTEMMFPATRAQLDEGARPVRFRNPRARYALIRRLLEREAERRPVVVWLDDVQWGFDALVFARHLMLEQVRRPCPVLLVLTAPNEALAEEPRNASAIEEILEIPGAEALEVGPLDESASEELVGSLLGLQGELAREVAARTGGNPLFAVQLLGDWVERGLLEVGERGFVLRAGESARLPDDLHTVWRTRLARLLAGHPPEARTALELAAALGRDVDLDELRAAAAPLGLEPDPSLVESLVASRLARADGDGFSFVHGMLRESLEREAVEGGRWRGLNRLCAQMLEARYEGTAPGIADRLGRHWLEAGAPKRAIGPLLQGSREHYDRSEFLSALVLLDAREHALRQVGVAAEATAWGEGWILRARVHQQQGQLEAALERARRAEKAARAHGWHGLLGDALRAMAYGKQQQGDLQGADQLYEAARTEYVGRGATEGVASCLHGLGEVARLRGDIERAGALHEEALALHVATGDVIGQAKCVRGLGIVAQHRGELDRAAVLFEEALGHYEAVGNPYGVAVCINDVAEVERWRGELESAEADYRRALETYEAIGSLDGVITQLNLGLVLMKRDHWGEARAHLLDGVHELERVGRLGFLGGTHAALLACVAHAGDWDAFDTHLARAQALLEGSAMVDIDIAWPARLAGDLAAAAGEAERAQGAYRLALAQYRGLDDEAGIAEVEGRLGE